MVRRNRGRMKAPERAVVVCKHVLDGTPIVYVGNDDGDYVVACACGFLFDGGTNVLQGKMISFSYLLSFDQDAATILQSLPEDTASERVGDARWSAFPFTE